jgi:hypothetical protein
MPKPPPPVLTPLTPHIVITAPAAGTTFNGGTNPDTIPVQGTVFLTCDDLGGDCDDAGRISGVTVKLGSSDAKPATFKPSTDIHRTTNLVRRVARGLGDDADLRGQMQEIESILPREIPVKADSGKLSKPTFLSSRLNPMRPAASPKRFPRRA